MMFVYNDINKNQMLFIFNEFHDMNDITRS